MQFSRKSRVVAVVIAAALAGGGIATATFAGDGGEDRGGGESVPGVPYIGEGSDTTPSAPEGGGGFEPVITSGTTYDPTILTKSISALAFMPEMDSVIDATTFENDSCVTPAGGAGEFNLDASVELPDGARIKQIVAYGEDSHATSIFITLFRLSETVGFFGVTRSSVDVVTFDTSAAAGEFAIASADNLGEVTGSIFSPGSFPFFFSSTDHRFHEILISGTGGAAAGTHVLCGVQVLYQVPSVSSAEAQAFYPISPVRAFDSRQAGYAPQNTVLAPNTSRVISIKDGRNGAGIVNLANAVPAGATAVTYNITLAGPTGPNFLAVTPGDAGSFTASAINFNGTADLANAATVSIAADRTIKIWCGDQTGSTHVIIDITGFYAPLPNMGN